MVFSKNPHRSLVFGPSSDQQQLFLKTDWLRQKSKWDPRETENCVRKPSEKYGVDLEESIGVLTV